MYTVISALGLKLGVNQRWADIDVTAFTVKQLLEQFRKLQFSLSETLTGKLVYLGLETLRREYSTCTDTVPVFFHNLPLPLETSEVPMMLIKKRAKYRDAIAAGYQFTPVTHANTVLENNQLNEVTDLRLTHKKSSMSYGDFVNCCLVSVNGFFHLADTDRVNGVVVSDAMKSVKLSGRNHVGIYSFNEVCKLQAVPITANMLIPTDDKRKIGLFIDTDLTDKQILVSIGGYLHWVDNQSLTRTGDNTFKIDFSKIPLLERYYESMQYLDLSGLQTNNTPANPMQIGSKDAWTTEFLLAYLQLSQSFVVILDRESIYVEKHPLRSTRTPDMYLHYQHPHFPLVSHWGRCHEYWLTEDDDHYLMTVVDCYKSNHLFNTMESERFLSLSDAREPENRKQHSDVWLLEIGTEIS